MEKIIRCMSSVWRNGFWKQLPPAYATIVYHSYDVLQDYTEQEIE